MKIKLGHKVKRQYWNGVFRVISMDLTGNYAHIKNIFDGRIFETKTDKLTIIK